MDKVKKISILGVPICLAEFDVAVRLIANLIKEKSSKIIVLANVNTLNCASRNQEYHQILRSADLILRDGAGIKWAVKKKGADPKYNFVGTDFIPRFCSATNSKRYKIFFFGARPGVAESAAKKLQDLVPGLHAAGYRHGYFEPSEEPLIVEEINNAHADILLVALGNPNQEMWIAKNQDKLNVPLCIGVGAFFDYLSGRVSRAPQWMLDAGIEWLFRLLNEPRRLWRRYLLGNSQFVFRVYRDIYFARRGRSSKRSVL